MIDEKELLQAHLASLPADERHPQKAAILNPGDRSADLKANAWRRKNEVEDSMIEMIDDKAMLKRLAPILHKLDQGKMDVTTAIQKASKLAFMKGLKMMMLSSSDKVVADLAKHFLALAGHTPTQKLELGRIDPDTPREALMSMISGSTKDLKDEGIEVIDDRQDKPKGT